MPIPDICPCCKQPGYWNREIDLDEELDGRIRIRWECDNILDCDYKTDWDVYDCRKLRPKKLRKPV